jgi:hypothetical protein
MKTTDTREYKQSVAVSLSLKHRPEASKKSGAMFLLSVFKKMIRAGQPEAFKKGRR